MTASASQSTWNLDPAHSAAEFKVRHMMIANVKGKFTGISGVLNLDESDLANSSVVATIDVGTIHTGDAQRDGHLKSADFLDAEKFPTLTFKSLAIDPIGPGELSVTGELTLHGITKTATFAVEGPGPQAKDPWGNLRIGISATTRINRKDFGLAWNSALESGGVLVGEEVSITLDAQFIKA